jgi:hypothetical protein
MEKLSVSGAFRFSEFLDKRLCTCTGNKPDRFPPHEYKSTQK